MLDSAVSCLQIHLEIDFFLIHCPLLLLHQLKRAVKEKQIHLTTWQRTMWFLSHFDPCGCPPACVCRHICSWLSLLSCRIRPTRFYITYVTNSFFFPCGHFFSVLSHICGIMLEDGRSNQEEVVNLSSYLFGRQVAVRWPCKLYWHWGDIHLVYPYSRSRCPFMKTCAICHRVSPWLCSLINLSMWDGWDLLAQHLSGLEPRDSASVLAKKSNRDGDC